MGCSMDREKDTVDNPYVAVHQLKTHMFLLIVTRAAHEKMGYFSRSKSTGGLPFVLIYRDLPVGRAGDSRFPATPTQQHYPPQPHGRGSATALGPAEPSSPPSSPPGLEDAISWPLRFAGNSNRS